MGVGGPTVGIPAVRWVVGHPVFHLRRYEDEAWDVWSSPLPADAKRIGLAGLRNRLQAHLDGLGRDRTAASIWGHLAMGRERIWLEAMIDDVTVLLRLLGPLGHDGNRQLPPPEPRLAG